jgi:hypothetical protein
MPRKTSYFDQACNEFISDWVVMACWCFPFVYFSIEPTASHFNIYCLHFCLISSVSYDEWRIKTVFIIYLIAELKIVIKRCANRSRTTFDAEENSLFRSNVQWIHPRKGGGLTGMQFKLNLSAWSVRFVANCFLVQILKQNKNQNIFRLSPLSSLKFCLYYLGSRLKLKVKKIC